MYSFIIEQFKGDNLGPIILLLNENNLPTSDLELRKQVFFVAREESKIVGCIGIELYKKKGLLRSLAVAENIKKSGVGRKLHNQIIEFAITNGLEKLYLLTTTANKYFEKLGWLKIERSLVPDAVLNSSEFSSICPSTAICMELSIIPYFAEFFFDDGFNCAQSVLLPFALRAGISKENALKLTTGFGAGMVYRGETCGAISGAMMAIGLAKGRCKADEHDSKENTYMLTNKLYKEFRRKHGTIICKELLKLENTNATGWDKADEMGLFDIQCPLYVKDAAIITAELLKD